LFNEWNADKKEISVADVFRSLCPYMTHEFQNTNYSCYLIAATLNNALTSVVEKCQLNQHLTNLGKNGRIIDKTGKVGIS
jgi:hypothetical protein